MGTSRISDQSPATSFSIAPRWVPAWKRVCVASFAFLPGVGVARAFAASPSFPLAMVSVRYSWRMLEGRGVESHSSDSNGAYYTGNMHRKGFPKGSWEDSLRFGKQFVAFPG